MKVNQSTLADDIFISVETLLPTCSFPTYHAHNVYEIYILNSGERNIFIGSKLYHTSPGVVAMIRLIFLIEVSEIHPIAVSV